ncbi:MAG: 3-oxoacyl-ACP synthase [Hymenobacter sp.]|nr:MAG: 3-oxoacyl-ACP synthase [Hymenobacter sp.]
MTSVSKATFHTAVVACAQQRFDQARAEMIAAQESSNTDTKSSAGDKYETGRAMAQQERDRHARQLHEAQQQLAAMQKINAQLPCATVRLGALARTSLGLFYISIGAGKLITAGGQEFMAVSTNAPIALALSGRGIGEEITFNGRQVQVLAVS